MERTQRQFGKRNLQILKNVAASQHGTTLMEMLLVIAITGILSTAMIQLFRAGILGWQTASQLAKLDMNSTKMYHTMARDIRASDQFMDVENHSLTLRQPAGQIRFRALDTDGQQKVIREEYNSQASAWRQVPRYPIADFSTLDVTIEFKQQSVNMVTLSVSGHNAATETTICKRL